MGIVFGKSTIHGALVPFAKGSLICILSLQLLILHEISVGKASIMKLLTVRMLIVQKIQ